MNEPIPDDKMLCYCKGIRYGMVRETIVTIDAKTVEQVTLACTAGGGCRTCHPEIQDLILEHRRQRNGTGMLGLIKRIFGRT